MCLILVMCVCASVPKPWCHCAGQDCVYRFGAIAIMEAGQNVCVSLCICIMCMFVYRGL